MRLQKFLSRAGVASRRKSEKLIESGRVRVDGRTVTRLGTTLNPDTAEVCVDGRRVELLPVQWVALHKPPGYACTRRDPTRRPTIYDLLPNRIAHLPYVGRLDFMSEGLLLLSNEGDLVHRLLHPSTGIDRIYRVQVRDPVPDDLPERLRTGIALSDGLVRARRAHWIRSSDRVPRAIELVLAEGRNRVIRRMLARLDVTILSLRRTSFGPIDLGALAAGETRELSQEERAALKRTAAPPSSSGARGP